MLTTGNDITTDGTNEHTHEPVMSEIPEMIRLIDMDKFDFASIQRKV